MSRFIDLHTHNIVPSDQQTLSIFALMVSSGAQVPTGGLFSAAIHPYAMAGFDITWIDRLAYIVSHERCVAIGETGLDMRQEYRATEKQQRAVFEEHIFLAEKLHLPLIIHAVKATPDVLRQMEKVTVPFVFHGFAGNVEVARQIIARGGMVSLGEKITRNGELAARVEAIDLSRILLETDDGDTPIQEIYEALAAIKNVSLEEIKTQIEMNFHTIFPSIL
ncbi:MAG: TatD family hydrolase [Mucinivorans sp.]